MRPRFSRFVPVAFVLSLGAATPAAAITLPSFDINLDLVLDGIAFSGTGAVPLAPGWATMNTRLDVAQSASGTSTLSGSIGFDSMTSKSTVSLTSTLYLDLTFTDMDATPGADFGGGLTDSMSGPTGTTLIILATKPLTTSIDGSFSVSQLLFIQGYLQGNAGATIQQAIDAYNDTAAGMIDPIVAVVSDPTVEYDLGVDIGGDSTFTDAISYSAASFLFDLANTDIEIDPDGTVMLDAMNLAFTGGVFDFVSDPPFTVLLSGPATGRVISQALPEPATTALLGLGLAGIAGLHRRRRSRA